MLQKILSQVMDLPYPISLKEAQKKLQETFCIVNKELHFISNITEDTLHTHNGINTFEFTDKNLESFSLFLPESGMYLNEQNRAYNLVKIPKRQWHKSFCWNFYKVTNCTIEKTFFPFTLFKILDTRTELWRSKTNVYYLNTIIGDIDTKGRIILHNPLFQQEIIDKGREDQTWKLK